MYIYLLDWWNAFRLNYFTGTLNKYSRCVNLFAA